jgi:CRISPR-associated protein Cmr3
MFQIRISARDSLIARDGRPFGITGSARIRCLNWFYPSVTAGSLRTLLGKSLTGAGSANPFLQDDLLFRLKKIEIFGPLPIIGDDLYVPIPRDLLVFQDTPNKPPRVAPLAPQPLEDEEGCNMPNYSQPASLYSLWPIQGDIGGKPLTIGAFWTMSKLVQWLTLKQGEEIAPPLAGIEGIADYPLKDVRVHVTISDNTGTAEPSHLFISESLSFSDEQSYGMLLGVKTKDIEIVQQLSGLNTLHPLGGERRLALFRKIQQDYWSLPQEINESVADASGLRMVLLTPAIFAGGWRPAWIDPCTFEGSPPGAPHLRLRLRGAALERWKPISGWSLEKNADGKSQQGPKPIRRLVPAGSAYFFQIVSGNTSEGLENLWLASVSDELQDQRDGFGLAAWGSWNMNLELFSKTKKDKKMGE